MADGSSRIPQLNGGIVARLTARGRGHRLARRDVGEQAAQAIGITAARIARAIES